MIIFQDNVLPADQLRVIKQSAIQAGFGTWAPPSHTYGTSAYRNMGWKGYHAPIHIAISSVMGRPAYPGSSFFRILTEDEDIRLIHSDRMDGDFTAITYLSDHEEVSGTAFYRHKETGLLEMPEFEKLTPEEVEYWSKDFKDDSKWEQTHFVRGDMGRMLVFSAPLFHARVPNRGIGTTPEDARMIHVCHFV